MGQFEILQRAWLLTLFVSVVIAVHDCAVAAKSPTGTSSVSLPATSNVTLLVPTDTRKARWVDPALTIAPEGTPGAVTYLRFDPGTIPISAHIESAVLELTFAGPSPKTIVLHACDSEWFEDQLNKKNAPVFDSRGIELTCMDGRPGEPARYSSPAFESLLSQWLRQDRPNFGFGVTLPSGTDLKEATFSSKEDPIPANRPALSVTYKDASAPAAPPYPTLDVPWKDDPQDVVIQTQNVKDFGAKGDGKTDDSAAFIAALAAAVKAGGGIVYAPAGRYRFEHEVNIPAAITLRGDWVSPQAGGLGKGTIFEIAVGRGDAAGKPFMDMSVASSLRDVTFYYPDQDIRAIAPYPYTIRTCFNGYLRHITFVNAYRAISHGYGNTNGGNLLAEHIYGTPLDIGLYVNVGFDYSSAASIRFSPIYWPAFETAVGNHKPGLAVAVARWTYAHATGIMGGDSATLHGCGIVVDGYRRGMCFWQCAVGVWMGGKLSAVSGGAGMRGQFYDVRLLNCAQALCLDSVQEHGDIFSNCRFDGDMAVSISTPWAIVFDRCRFRGHSSNVKCVSPAAKVSILSSTFAGNGEVRFDAGRIALTNNRFEATRPRILTLGKNIEAAVLIGSHFDVSPGYVDASSRALVQDRPIDMPLWPAPPGGTNPLRVPRSRKVVYASLDPYNAPADGRTDASAALQKALDALGADGGTVFLHPGQYLLRAPIVVPPRVELRGVGDVLARTMNQGYLSPTNITGSTLVVDNGQGSESAPAAITLGADSGVSGVAIVHPARHVLGELLAFPPAILGKGDRCYVTNSDLVDPYVGIEMRNVNSYLIKDIITGSDHLGARIVGGSGGVIENFAAHGQYLGVYTLASWGMPSFQDSTTQLAKTTTAIEIDGATDLLVQACGQFGIRNGYIVRGAGQGKPCSVTFRLLTCDTVTGDGIRLEGNSHIVVIGYQNLTTWKSVTIRTTSDYTGDSLLSGGMLRNLWMECAGPGRIEIRGATIPWVPAKVLEDAGNVLVCASLSEIDTLRVAPGAKFQALANVDERNALQTAPSPNFVFALNAPIPK